FSPSFASTFDSFSFRPAPTPATSSADLSKTISSSVISDLTANYNNTFGDHTVGGLLGFSWQRDVSDRNYFFLQGFPDDELLITATNALEVPTKSASITEVGLNSLFGRFSYNYKGKYFATVNLRRDKSSRFGPDNKDAFFPSIAASWNIAQESFLKDSNLVNILRLRASYGEVGSVNVGDFNYIQFFERGFRDDASYNGQPAIGVSSELVNTDIRWEETTEYNIGLDFALFGNRLKGGIDVYDRQTSDALLASNFPLESGAQDFTSNFADISNKGVEFEIAGDIIRSKDFNWSAAFNISKNRNKLEKFIGDNLFPFVLDRFEEGSEIGLIKGHIVEGIFQNQAEVDALNSTSPTGFYQRPGTGAGDYKFEDLNGDGVIDQDDRRNLGSSQPDFFGGFNTTISYKGFELSSFFNFSKGTESTFLGSFFNSTNPGFGKNIVSMYDYPNRWSVDNTSASLPRLVFGDPNQNDRVSNATVFDSSYLRLRNVQLKYNFGNQITEALSLTNLSLFMSASNIWTLTDYPGVDPAVGSATAFGTDNGSPYPSAKSWTFGINVNF
ncbi:MAG: SusC/RagA family TonB-linked outer membrane protein, partial [Bacteroidota bacterium]